MNDELNSFIANYRNELDRQHDLGMQNLDNNRRIQFQNLMALNEQEYKQLYNIVTRNRGTKLPNLAYNVGDSHVNMNYGTRLSPEDTAFLNRLGLKLVG